MDVTSVRHLRGYRAYSMKPSKNFCRGIPNFLGDSHHHLRVVVGKLATPTSRVKTPGPREVPKLVPTIHVSLSDSLIRTQQL